jgi:hypothetical protein
METPEEVEEDTTVEVAVILVEVVPRTYTT